MIDILKRAIKNRFQLLIHLLNEQNTRNEKQVFFIILIILEDFLFFPEKRELIYINQFLDSIQINQMNEIMRCHISIVKRDMDTFFGTFSKQNQTRNLKIIDKLTKKWVTF